MDGNNQYQPFQKHTKRILPCNFQVFSHNSKSKVTGEINKKGFSFFKRSSHYVTHTGIQWHDFGSLQPQPPRLNQSSHHNLLTSDWKTRTSQQLLTSSRNC
ncbi:hypothetical protein AAY473_018888, partial [Plecturocebus cupreus]